MGTWFGGTAGAGAASRCHGNVNMVQRHAVKMTGIKFVPTSEWRVQCRTEECAERTWERGTGAPLVPSQSFRRGILTVDSGAYMHIPPA